MPNSHQDTEELVIRGPVLVPMGWIVALFGAAGTAVMISFTVGVWSAATSTKVEAQAHEIEKLRGWQNTISDDVTRVKTILEIRFPEAAKRAEELNQ